MFDYSYQVRTFNKHLSIIGQFYMITTSIKC